MADWQHLVAMATGTAGRLFGEPVRLSFFKGGKVDPSRPPVDTRAQPHLPGETDVTPGRGNSSFQTSLVGGTGLLIIQKSDFAGPLQQGDKVRLDARDGQPWFDILTADANGVAQIVATISLAGKLAAPP